MKTETEIKKFVEQIKVVYEKHKEKSLTNRFFKHKDIIPLIHELNKRCCCRSEEIGESVEQRKIYLIKMGRGKTNVLLWSQMHGNEPTATSAIFDVLNFLTTDDENNEYRKTILDELTLYFVPMLNPDGAEVFTRENALGIDINRDALALSSPESKILKNIRDKTNAAYGFNLHDQQIYYAAGNTDKPAAISFLATAFNEAKDIDEKRKSAMRTIVAMNNMLQNEIKDMVGRYNDDFMPNAFGDNIVMWGTPVILIESGGINSEDSEKQTIRKLNYLSILTGLYSIAIKYTSDVNYKDYFNIPINKEEKFFDIILRNVKCHSNDKEYIVDIGIRGTIKYCISTNQHITDYKIVQIGDLSRYCGYVDVDAKQLKFQSNDNKNIEPHKACLNSAANFVLLDKDGELKYRIKDGQII